MDSTDRGQIKFRLDQLIEVHGLKHWSFAARRDDVFVTAVNAATIDLPEDTPFANRVYAAAHGDSPICPIGGIRSLNSIEKGWRFCGRAASCECARASVSAKSKASDHAARLEKVSATLMNRYGTTNPGQTPTAKEAHANFYADDRKKYEAITRLKTSMLSKYGVENSCYIDSERTANHARKIARDRMSDDAKAVLDQPEVLLAMLEACSPKRVADRIGVTYATVCRYAKMYGWTSPRGSSYENEIASFLTLHNIAHRINDRRVIRPLEADFYIESHNLIIEFNGLYWHSDRVVDRLYHRRKYDAAKAAGLRLLMINEDEYVERRETIQRKILNLCGLSTKGVGARNLLIKSIENSVAKEFVSEHHIQGSSSTTWRSFGAFENDILKSVVILGRQRGTNKADLVRFCTSGEIHAGLMSRFMSHITKAVEEEIVTFADLRYSDGNLYRRCGFVEVGVIPPDYKYAYRGKTLHKSLFTKARIAKKFDIDMSVLTEREAMSALGYDRIYDCGKIKFVYPASPK